MDLASITRFVKRNLRHPVLVYAVVAVVGVVIVVLAVAPLTSGIVARGSERGMEIRSRLVFNSIRDQVAAGLATAAGTNLVPFFERLTEDEQLQALGFCNEGGKLEHATQQMPKSVACPDLARGKADTFFKVYDGDHRL